MRTLGLCYLATLVVVVLLLAAGESEDSPRGVLLVTLMVGLGAALSIVAVLP